jgi:hypothetical protein
MNKTVNVVVGVGQGFVGGDCFVDSHGRYFLSSFVVLIIASLAPVVKGFLKLFSSFF